MKKIRSCIIGVGFIGKQHIETIRRIPNTEVVAISDANEALAEATAKQLGIPYYTADYHKLLENAEINVVHNCTPVSLHFSISKEALLAGKHVYCEKPFTMNTAQAKELSELALRCGLLCGVNFNYRQNAMIWEMRERVRSGEVGTLFTVNARYLQDWLLYETDTDWRMDPALGGDSRAISDIGSHLFDAMQVVAQQKITAVNARLITAYPTRKRFEKSGGTFSGAAGGSFETISVKNEDEAFIMVRFEGGAHGLCRVSQVCAGRKNAMAVEVEGSRCSLAWNQERPDRLWVGRRDTPNEMVYADKKFLTGRAKELSYLPAGHPLGWQDALKNAIEAFYTAVRREKAGPQNYATFADGAYVMQIIDACLKSNSAGQWMEV